MELVQWLAVTFEERGIDYTQWPEDATDVNQSNYEVTIEGWEVKSKYSDRMVDISFDCEGDFKYIDEYEDDNSCTREEFFEFIEANPNYAKDLIAKHKDIIGRIAELNKVAYDAVEQAMKLSEEVCLPYSCSMPAGVADLDENSDWDSSRC